MSPSISIIICTSNRAEHLRQTLASLANVCLPPDMPVEMLVVDNGSDNTPDVTRACLLPGMTVNYVAEPRRGKGFAYNASLAHARGDILLYTDDDVRPPADWISGLCAPILSGEAHAVQGGIRLAPHLERDWMEARHRSYFADTLTWDTVTPRRLIGANMAFSRDVLSKVPAFDEELGPGAMGFWEDSLFAEQLAAAGYRVAPDLAAYVEHHFDAARLSRADLLRRADKDGRSNAYVSYHWDHYDAPNPEQSLRHARMGLKMGRLTGKARWPYTEGASLWELEWVFKVGYYEQYLVERKRPRNYDKNGLVKRQT